MTESKPSRDPDDQNSVMIRASSSITLEQVDTIVQAVQACGRACDVQIVNDYHGYLSILVEPNARDNELKSFFVSGTAQRLELFKTHDDNMLSMATFDDIGELTKRLLDLIGQW